jgi:hypothetical protein
MPPDLEHQRPLSSAKLAEHSNWLTKELSRILNDLPPISQTFLQSRNKSKIRMLLTVSIYKYWIGVNLKASIIIEEYSMF